MSNHFGLQIAIQELKDHHNRSLAGIDSQKQAASTFLAAASIGLPLLSAARSFSNPISLVPDDWRLPIYIGAIVGYVALMAICIHVLGPVKVLGPLRTTKEQVDLFFRSQEEAEILESEIRRYLNIAPENQKTLKQLVDLVRAAGWLLLLDTILLLILL